MPRGGAIIARMRVDGTWDAGRGLWKKTRARFESNGLRESHVMPALFSVSDEENEVVCMIGRMLTTYCGQQMMGVKRLSMLYLLSLPFGG